MKNLGFLLFLNLLVLSCSSPEARDPVTRKTGSYINESVARNKKLLQREEAIIQGIIKEDTVHDYLSSDSGFWYFYNKRTADSISTIKPEYGDVVSFDYEIRTLSDQPIYKKGELPTKTYTMDKEELFSGLRDGLKLMKEGETVTFLFPSYKAFGYYGDKNRIGTNLPVKTVVSLHSIRKKEAINNKS